MRYAASTFFPFINQLNIKIMAEIKLTFSEWVKKQLTQEQVEERLNKRITNSEKQKQSDSLFAKRHIAKGTKW